MIIVCYPGDKSKSKDGNGHSKTYAPFQMADTISPIIKKCFTDSKIAQSYSLGRTKTTQIINGAVKPFYK